jgi:hypothetical protein
MHAGDVNGQDGYSPFPGSINQIIIKLEPYVRQLEGTGGAVGEFVNPKYKDISRTAFLKPTRLECMMQDYPKTLSSAEAVGFTSFLEVCTVALNFWLPRGSKMAHSFCSFILWILPNVRTFQKKCSPLDLVMCWILDTGLLNGWHLLYASSVAYFFARGGIQLHNAHACWHARPTRAFCPFVMMCAMFGKNDQSPVVACCCNMMLASFLSVVECGLGHISGCTIVQAGCILTFA